MRVSESGGGGKGVQGLKDCRGFLDLEEEIILQIQSPFRIWRVRRSPTEYSKGYEDSEDEEEENSEWEEGDLLEGSIDKMAPSARTKFRRPQRLILVVVVLVALVCIAIAVSVHVATKKAGAGLIPPDPEVPLPPSPSVERRFRRGAVCSDGRPCSDVGSESWDFCAAALESTIAAVPQRSYSLSEKRSVQFCERTHLYCRRTTVFCLYLQVLLNMSESHFDEYEHYNFEIDKHIYSGHSGKQRTKKEASEHTNHFDPSGHSRKIVTKLQNTEHNKKYEPTKAKS